MLHSVAKIFLSTTFASIKRQQKKHATPKQELKSALFSLSFKVHKGRTNCANWKLINVRADCFYFDVD